MLQLLSPPRNHLMTDDTYDPPRPCTASQIESRSSISSVPSSHYASSATSAKSRRSSATSYSSTISKINYDIPHLTKTPWELDRHKKNSVWRRTRMEHENPFPPSVFKKLPREVYDCIVEQLEQLHLGEEQSCQSCYLRDLCSLSLTSRAWDRAATLQMYRKVRLLSHDECPKMPKLKVKGTSRLKLLRRTLRERQALARCVRELHLSDFHALYQNASIEREEIANLVASLVMACPNLERVVGFHIPYTHTFDRLSHALSTRRNLKERVWLLSESTGLEPDEEEEEDDPSNIYYHAASDPAERFLELNSNHPNLTTLVLHQQQSYPSNSLTFRSIIGTFRKMPSLRHLSISSISASTFTNLALNALPPYLKSLRLENLPGINDKGLHRFATSVLPTSLQSLTLINLEISNLLTIATFLSPHLPDLTHFTLSQHRAPLLPSSDSEIPFLRSKNLRHLHWEIRSQASPPPALLSHSGLPTRESSSAHFPFANSEPISCLATSLLAANIRNGGFPSLTKLRAPHDPQGVLQQLCRPRASALLPSDSSLLTSPPRQSPPPSPAPQETRFNAFGPSDGLSSFLFPELVGAVNPTPEAPSPEKPTENERADRADSAMSSPLSADFPLHTPPPVPKSHSRQLSIPASTTPAHSRLLAQSRILLARKQPFIHVKVIDPKGQVRVSKPIHGFLGKLDSKIVYEVRPDRQRVAHECGGWEGGIGGWDDGSGGGMREDGCQWIMGIGDVIGEWEMLGNGGLVGCRHLGRAGRRAVRVEELF